MEITEEIPTSLSQGMKVELWDVDSVIPYARNARNIPQSAIDKVAASIQEFGWRQPLVVDQKGVIIVGHTRHLAARKLGFTQVPVHVAVGLTPSQVKAYRLMDNRSGDESKWNYELLAVEFEELKDLVVDLSLTGFDPAELEPIMSADWKPPEATGDMETDHTLGGGFKFSVSFTKDQKPIIESAIEKVRLDQDDDSIPEGRALELICGDFLAS